MAVFVHYVAIICFKLLFVDRPGLTATFRAQLGGASIAYAVKRFFGLDQAQEHNFESIHTTSLFDNGLVIVK